MLAAFSCHALAPELAAKIAAGEGDERVAALNEAVAKGEPQLAEFLHAMLDGRVRVKDGKALIDAPEGDEPIVNNRMRREIDAALAGLDLVSPDREVRAKALATLRDEADAARLPMFEKALAAETDAGLNAASDRIKRNPDDAQFHELAARGFERKNKRLAQHRALAEAYFRRDNIMGAVDQMELAVKAKDGDFYETSSAESRLRELKLAFKTRALMPGEKRDTPRDKEEEENERNPRPQGRR